MPIFKLRDEILFPPVELAAESGILAVGGDLSPQRLLEAYRRGIFPWYSEDDPIIWWSPDPRFVLFPEEMKVSRTMRQVLRRGLFRISFDTAFRAVVEGCRSGREKQPGTWITDDMADAYGKLHDLGYAHSVEAWRGDDLAGGLYGISLGRCFFGESMFYTVSNASKAAFIVMVRALMERDFALVDCQVHTAHLESLGARFIGRERYVSLLEEHLKFPTLRGSWEHFLSDVESPEER
ncbi:MAG TPA: leucyl/phenylalanyl-tRNA--protein transferase [Spirochaetes bacterium]|nr:leucyl/phenylalanyl-tRNA--protein transferase [Spirochaetota bacterium]